LVRPNIFHVSYRLPLSDRTIAGAAALGVLG
jgi:hypothetical protein